MRRRIAAAILAGLMSLGVTAAVTTTPAVAEVTPCC
jgi:hypothetical protein